MTQQHFTRLIRYTLLPLMATAALWSADPVPFVDGFCDKPELNIPASECEALHDFWDATDGPHWDRQDGWGGSTPMSLPGSMSPSRMRVTMKKNQFTNSGFTRTI